MTTSDNNLLPLFPLGTVLFPGMLLPLHLFEERYLRLIEERQGVDPIFGVILTLHGREVGDRPDVHEVGTAATLVGLGRYPGGRYDAVIRGTQRFRADRGHWENGYLTAPVRWLEEEAGGAHNDRLASRVSRSYENFLAALEQATNVDAPRDPLELAPAELAYALCARLPLNTWEQQRLLEAPTTADRLDDLLTILRRERTLLQQTGAGGATIDHPGGRFLAN